MKAALRASALHDIGERFEDRLEASSGAVNAARGAVSGLAEGSRAIGSLSRLIDEEIDKGELELETGAVVKKWIARAGAALDNLGKQAENRVLIAEGSLRAWKDAIETTKKAYDLEIARIPKPEEASEPEASEPRDPLADMASEDPPKRTRKKSIKARRQAAEAS
jgi:hypothetical protein